MTAELEALVAAGRCSSLDAAFARSLSRLSGDASPLLELGAAEASRAVTAGHVCADLAELGGGPVLVDGRETGLRWPEAGPWREALAASPAVGDGSGPTPLVLDPAARLYLLRHWRHERALAEAVRARSAAVTGAGASAADLERLFPAPPDPGLDPDGGGVAGQRAAARTALGGLFTAISGGPGTGKTTVVARYLCLEIERALAAGDRPPRVALLAPTGKAASRLADSLRAAVDGGSPGRVLASGTVLAALPREASTIHRALGWNPRTGGFLRDARTPLTADVVVVDETSMVDLALLAALVAAVPARARLVLLGDRDQLASVEAGAAFGDICAGLPEAGDPAARGLAARVVRLTHPFRFGAGIRALAEAIRAGDAERALGVLDDPALPGISLLEAGDADEQWFRIADPAGAGFAPCLAARDPAARLDALGRFRVLTAHRRGPDGSERLNALLERALAPTVAGATAPGWFPGRPVMVTRNDHGLGLFNGDTGVTVTGEDGRPAVCFPASPEPRRIPVLRLPAHETAFAVTIHKAQGSEFDEVLVVLPLAPSPVLTRELLYTAVTRARSKVAICASREAVRRAVTTPIRRSSGLRDRLWGMGASS
jgi:exodeoxyribonuclease V alpha subunit